MGPVQRWKCRLECPALAVTHREKEPATLVRYYFARSGRGEPVLVVEVWSWEG